MGPEHYLRRFLGELEDQPELAGELRAAEEDEGRWYLRAPGLGLEFVADAERRVTTVFLYCDPMGDIRAFERKLPDGLTRDMGRQQVRELLGAPEREGEASRIPVLGEGPAWDRYEVGDRLVHVSFRPDGPGISKVTLMTAESRP